MELLEGEKLQQIKVQEKENEERQEGEKEEENIQEEEIGRAMSRIKGKKAPRMDGIPIEAWRYAGTAVKKELIMKQVWKNGAMPKDWRTSILVPLYKKGDQEVLENYRGISLLCAAYKIYAEIIRGRLEEEVERKMLSESQAGFRKGRSTIDNIFVLDHLIQGEKQKKGKEKIYALFVNLKAIFDNIDRGKLWEILEEKGVQ